MDIIFVNCIKLRNKAEKFIKKTNSSPLDLDNSKIWVLSDYKKIFGYLTVRLLHSHVYELTSFYIMPRLRNREYGKKMLLAVFQNALTSGITTIQTGHEKTAKNLIHLFKSLGFELQCYEDLNNNQPMQFSVSEKSVYHSFLSFFNESIQNSLILNPTENFPYRDGLTTELFEGLYVSENKRYIKDKIIFGGRNDFTDIFNLVEDIWKKRLNCAAIDLKTFSGLNAHLLFFLCTANPGDKVVLLPEEAGGHYSTSNILTKIGLKVIPLIVDENNCKVNIEESRSLISKNNPRFILIDRSEGLQYEDFSWLSEFNCTKVFDASQYLTQIITKYYPNPLETFDILISTLHKNYPGPQKCLICTKNNDKVWQDYVVNSKTFISNNHPADIISSVIPLLDSEKIEYYSAECINCANKLYEELLKNELPVIKRKDSEFYTLHIWLKSETQEQTYRHYLNLEELNILVNYRLLPYGLGYGLRIGVNAAVRQGLRNQHIHELAEIMKEAYFTKNVSNRLKRRAENFIKTLTAKLSDSI